MKPKLFLVDVSNFIFRSYFALPPMSNKRGEATHALYGFIRSIQKLIHEFDVSHMAAVFDGPGGKDARTAIYEQYKAHRKPTPEDLPHQVDWALEYCALAGIPTISIKGVEADDSIGTIAVKMAKQGHHAYLCSSDKDLAQLVTQDISMLQTHKNNLLVDPAQVEEIFGVRPDQIIDLLAIMGDASDNIPGLPGFGPKTAVKLLQEFGSLEKILANIDKVAGKKKQETLRDEAHLALLSQQLATLNLQVDVPSSPDDYELQEPDQEGLIAFYQDKNFTGLLRDATGAAPKAKKKAQKTQVEEVDDPLALAALISTLQGHKEIAFAITETSLSFSVKEGCAFHLPLEQQLIDALRPLFANTDLKLIGHNIKESVHILARNGIKVANMSFDTIFDTRIASYVLNSHDKRHSLDHLALHLFGKDELSSSSEKADYTLRLKNHFEPLLSTRRLGDIFYKLEMPLVPILVKMERAGIYVDQSKLKNLSITFHAILAKLETEIHQLAGEEFKINSPKQLSEVLYEKLKIAPPPPPRHHAIQHRCGGFGSASSRPPDHQQSARVQNLRQAPLHLRRHPSQPD